MHVARYFVRFALVASLTAPAMTPVDAQSYRQYCQQRAERLSGYRQGNDVAGGAVRGAIGGAIVGSILGSGKKDRRRGAAAGALLGGISSASRPNSKAARIYRLEFEDCMRRR